MIAPLILYSPGSFLFFEQYSSSVVVPVIIPLGALLFYTICFQVIELSALTPKYNLSPDKRTMPNVPVISVERIKQYDIQEFVGRSVILSFFSQMQICGTDSFL